MNDRARAVYETDTSHQCQWETGGQRCQNAGSVSSATLGGGPWYCMPHYRCDSQQDGMRIIVESMRRPPPSPAKPQAVTTESVDEIRVRCRAILAQMTYPAPSNTWAWKLLHEARHGKSLMPIQVALVSRALGIDPDDIGPHFDEGRYAQQLNRAVAAQSDPGELG